MLGSVSGLGQKRSHVGLWSTAVLTVCLVVVGYLSAASQGPLKTKPVATSHRPDFVFVQTPTIAAVGPLAQRFPLGSRIARLNHAAGNTVELTTEFFAAADPQISFDATKILFAAQKAKGDHWQIWEMELDGSHKRQVTQCAADCLDAAYLPVNEIAFTVEEAQQSYLAVSKLDGMQFRRITFGPAPFQLQTVLLDGRILASAPWPLSAASTASRALYTLRPDGTALESFRCEHRNSAVQADAAELEDGSLVFVENPGNGSVAGELARIQRGSVQTSSFGSPQPIFFSPRQISADELLVSKEEPVAAGSVGKFDLYILRTKNGTLAERIFADEKLSSLQAVPVEPREVPKHFWSTLSPESKTGYFICLNSYSSADVARQRIAEMIAAVRVLTANSAEGKERSLGEAPVESDGSFYVQVPANTPVRFVLLDANGKTIHEERGWSWTRPGEERGCPGCHADKALAPENRWPLTLKRFDTPTPLGDIEHGSTTSQAN